MSELSYHKATDRRCYNGAMCSDLTRETASIENLYKILKKEFPEASVTYFPMEEQWKGFNQHHAVTGFFWEKGDALIATIKTLRNSQPR